MTTLRARLLGDGDGRRLLAVGAVTGLSGIATSEITRALLHRETGPVVAVAETVRDLTPGSIAVPLVHLVGHLDKPLLVSGTVIVLVGLAALAARLQAHRPWASYLLLTVLAVLAGLAVFGRTGAGPYDVLPVLVGYVTWLIVLPWLVDAAVGGAATNPRDSLAPTATDRRGFLLRTSGVAAAGVVGLGLSRLLGRGRVKVEQARNLLRLPATAGTVPAGADLGASPYPWRTPNRDFYQIDTALALPEITPDEWELRIHGMVDQEVTVTYADLVGQQLTQDWITLCCVSNEVGGELIGNAYFSGVPIRDLLAKAGVQDGADAVKQTSDDGWTCGTPLSALTDPDRNAMLAVAMNGRPLPIEHGFPVRMVVPGLYGYVSATKWVVDLEVTRFADFTAYWTDRGWGEKGPVKTESRIDVPRNGGGTSSGSVRIGGSAWAQHTGIEKVEIQLDGGRWQQVDIGEVPSDDCWVQWVGTVDLKPGRHLLSVRATDKSGYTQTPARADVLPDGATGWHTVEFTSG